MFKSVQNNDFMHYTTVGLLVYSFRAIHWTSECQIIRHIIKGTMLSFSQKC